MTTPFYEKNGITIYCGEASEVLSTLEPEFDLTVTSPPYDNLRDYNGYTFDFEAIAGQLWRVTKPGGVVVWVVGDATINGSETGTSFRQALHFMELGFNLHDTMIYDKNSFRFPDKTRYHQVFEYMFVFSKNEPLTKNLIVDRKNIYLSHTNTNLKRERNGHKTRRSGHIPTKYGKRFNIWRYAIGKYNTTYDNCAYQHPAIFPEALARDHIISWSNPGDIVLDPMVGSGTTLKMAQALGRRAVGIELSEEYCRIAVDRLRQPSFFSIRTANKRLYPTARQTVLFEDTDASEATK